MRYRPNRIITMCDSREIGKGSEVLQQFQDQASDLMANFVHTLERFDEPGMVCTVSRVAHIPGGRLVRAELVDERIDVEILQREVSDDFVIALALASNTVGHYMTRR